MILEQDRYCSKPHDPIQSQIVPSASAVTEEDHMTKNN